MTPLDQAHSQMDQTPEDAAGRLRFYERLAAVELFLLLEEEAAGDRIKPAVFPLEGGDYVLVFDTEARLSDFTGTETPFAAMSGRRIVDLIKGHSLGLGVNLGVAPSSILLPPEVILWLGETLANEGKEAIDKPVELGVPSGIDAGLMRALDARLSGAAGLAKQAFLVGVTYESGRKGNLLAFVGTREGAEAALRQAVLDVVSFSSRETAIDVVFFAPGDPVIVRLERAGLRFDIPTPEAAEFTPVAPGMDPDSPPRLR